VGCEPRKPKPLKRKEARVNQIEFLCFVRKFSEWIAILLLRTFALLVVVAV